ncbi:MAG: YcxB family protein [Emergencia timonensis]|uniref:YcxB family protein n=1 Tax=Emergencia timonensis TaxID=1776384 RepID=UPI000836E01C|nr:YcxB family protein [Emergencia timonensis]WNX90649.1 YcxB family protein [Emergencia timonensis]
MTTIFENQCTYTYEYYLQLKRATLDKSFVNTCYSALVIITALGVLTVVKNWYTFTIAAVVALIFVLYRLIGTPIRLASFAAKKNRQVHGRDIETINHFYEDHLLAVNTLSQGKTNIKYEEVKTLMQSKNLFIIGMDKGLVLLIDKDGFLKGTVEEFLIFMKEKCVNAEVKI